MWHSVVWHRYWTLVPADHALVVGPGEFSSARKFELGRSKIQNGARPFEPIKGRPERDRQLTVNWPSMGKAIFFAPCMADPLWRSDAGPLRCRSERVGRDKKGGSAFRIRKQFASVDHHGNRHTRCLAAALPGKFDRLQRISLSRPFSRAGTRHRHCDISWREI